MKLKIFFIALCVCAFSFAQETQNIKSGIITLKNNEKIQFSNLIYEGEKVIYTNSITQQVEHLYVQSIVSIDEGAKFTEAELSKIKTENTANHIAETSVPQQKFLVYKNSRNILLDGEVQSKTQLKELMKEHPKALKKLQVGRSNRDAGTISMALGGTIFILNGVANLTAKEPRDNPQTYFFVGGGLAALGLVFNITGAQTMKKAVAEYNESPSVAELNQNKTQLNLTVNSAGAGLSLRF